MNRLFVVLIMVLAVTVVIVPTAQADTRYFCPSSGDWDVATNWDSNAACTNNDDGVPTAADRAIIQSGDTCRVDVNNAVADSVNVENTATLNIAAGGTLTIDDTAASKTTIAGTLNLQASNSVLAFVTNSQTIDGAGKLVGQHGDATITVPTGVTLTNDTTIEGALKITGDGTFLNHGTVHANRAATLEISTSTFDDDSTALWQISTSSSAILKLDASGAAAALEGAFTVSTGTLDVDAPGFETSGRLTFDGGTIDCSGLTGSEVAKFTG